MYFLKVFVSVAFILSVFVHIIGRLSIPNDLLTNILYGGIFVPLILQKIWFGVWFRCQSILTACGYILLSAVFIFVAIVCINDALFLDMLWVKVMISMEKGIKNAIGELSAIILFFMVNNILFLFSLIYLWNHKYFKRKHRLLHVLFLFIQAVYLIIGIPLILWMGTYLWHDLGL